LTVLGIAIGIAAVVWVVAIGKTGAERVEAQLRGLGDNLVWVEAGARNINGVRTGTHGTTTLTVEDADAILADVHLIKSLSPQIDGTVLMASRDRTWTTRSRGVGPDFFDIKRWTVAKGAHFTDEDVSSAAEVCVIGQTVRDQLFGADDPVGQLVRIGVIPFRVIGVLAPKGQSATGQDQDDNIFVPHSTAQKKLRGKGLAWVDDILCSARSPEEVAPAARQIADLIRERHHIGADGDDDFNIRHPEELIKAQLDASRTFALLLIGVASVALLVGGVGVMNVMLASVAERTREIGVRLAVGAPEWAVQAQFLIEAVVLTLFGGIQGAMLSCVGSFMLGRFLGWPVSIPIQALIVAAACSVVVGVFFGFYPSRLAARLDPIAALRSE
jgi:putative ABC transport system permease protein